MLRIISILSILFVFGVSAQDTTGIRLIEKSKIEVDSSAYWNMDVIGNHFVSLNGTISKIDTSGELKFSQSVKAFGETSALVSINTFFLIHFSEEQQTISYLDNSLTIYEGSFELSDQDIVQATLISASSQPDKIWVLDDLNSTLYQLAMKDKRQTREIGNLSGLLNFNSVSQIIEAGNKLHVLTPEGIFILDLYGSLIEVLREENISYIDANESHLYTLRDGVLTIRDVKTGTTTSVLLPIQDVFQVKIVNGALFARTPKNVHKFELQMLD